MAVLIHHPDMDIVARRGGEVGQWRVSLGTTEVGLALTRRSGGWTLTWGARGRHTRRLRTWPAAWAYVAKHAHELRDGRPVDDRDG